MFKSLAGMFDRFRSLEVRGLEGVTKPSEHFGLRDNKWSEVEKYANGLPWDFPLGQIGPDDVSNAGGDRTSLVAQLNHWKEYRKLQEQNLDTFADIQAERLTTAKAVLAARYADAQNDSKLNDAVYKHTSQMGVLAQKNLNSEELARLQMELGIKLEGHKHNLNRDYEQAQFGEQTSLESTRLEVRKTSLVDRYRSMRQQALTPSQKEETYAPTPGRVLRFGRRAS